MTWYSLTLSYLYAQKSDVPNNIKQAVAILHVETPDSLKEVIKHKNRTELYELLYPYGQDFKILYQWAYSDDNLRLKKFMMRKGISDPIHQEMIILITFQRHLLGQILKEEELLKSYMILEKKWAKEDEIRYTADTLRGIYIPKDLEDCFKEINKMWSDSLQNKMKNLSEDNFVGSVHLGFGTWLRNNWYLWKGARLLKYFNTMGIYNAESMSGIILISYHRFLNRRDLNLDEQIRKDKDFWEKAKIADLEEKKRELIKYNSYKIGDTVWFKYELGYSSQDQEDKYDDGTCMAKGLVVEKKTNTLYIKVKVLNTCDKKGIIYYDSDRILVLNKKTKKWEKPMRRVIKSIKRNREYWCHYKDWCLE